MGPAMVPRGRRGWWQSLGLAVTVATLLGSGPVDATSICTLYGGCQSVVSIGVRTGSGRPTHSVTGMAGDHDHTLPPPAPSTTHDYTTVPAAGRPAAERLNGARKRRESINELRATLRQILLARDPNSHSRPARQQLSVDTPPEQLVGRVVIKNWPLLSLIIVTLCILLRIRHGQLERVRVPALKTLLTSTSTASESSTATATPICDSSPSSNAVGSRSCPTPPRSPVTTRHSLMARSPQDEGSSSDESRRGSISSMGSTSAGTTPTVGRRRRKKSTLREQGSPKSKPKCGLARIKARLSRRSSILAESTKQHSPPPPLITVQ
eukprot:m.18439 g.18439  ORF g.18439 m.18439 type:complete len:323 (-) comp9659_c0_seq1:186-1154(-)